jgi:EmrB/QacA subfamily drug resistance transporter
VVILGAIMAMLDITVVIVALEQLKIEFKTDLNTIQWVMTGYTLALATVIPLSGWAANRYGTKRIYLTAVVLFVLGSALAGTAWSAESLILFRVIQGLGGGMLMPLGMTILTKAAGPERIGRVMAVLGVPMLLGPIVGPILGGWLVDAGAWRWIFFINVPVGLVTLLIGMKILDKDEPEPGERLDFLGLLLLSPGLAALIYGLAKVPEKGGLGYTEVWAPAGAGALLVIAFVWHALRTPHALIDLKLFKDRGYSVATATLVLFTISFFGAGLLFPLYFQQVRGEGALQAGLLIAPQGIGAMIMMPIAGAVVDRIGSARIAQAGIAVIVAGMVVFTQLEADTSYWVLGGALFVLGLGMGMAMMPIMSAALKTLKPNDVAKASTSLNILQQVAASIGTAMLSVLLTNAITDRVPPPPPGTPVPAPGTPVPDAVREQIAPFVADGFAATFVWALVFIAVALLPALLLPRGKAAAMGAAAAAASGEAPEREKVS